MNILKPSQAPMLNAVLARSEDGETTPELDTCPEIDLSEEDIFGIQEHLLTFVKDGFLLHGSPNGELKRLKPSESYDATEYKRESVTAVFATDQPTIAAARAVAGQHMTRWTKQTIFVVDNEEALNQAGYIYILPPKTFRQHERDASEYQSPQPVAPITKVKISPQVMVPFFRSVAEYRQDLDPATDNLRPEAVKTEDITLALVTLKHALDNVGTLTSNPTLSPYSPQVEWFRRVAPIAENIAPVLSRLKDLGTKEQQEMAKNLHRQYVRAHIGTGAAPEDVRDIVHQAADRANPILIMLNPALSKEEPGD